ncbi:hypothetical protein ES332_D09G060200v1 [Gossypium tomentosum]|uniref:Uncharacterized protein n=1 Tax=Gossypium tomentosum TaxID=34277 RepID=A0A5D2JEP6_GOSTO|nr:hypothetical protein ES332_D09G060200v1 [Gossypium tomentosum]
MSFFMAWQFTSMWSHCDKLWRLVFFAIVWSLWNHRNEMIYKDKIWDRKQQLVNLVRSWEPSLSGHVNFIVDGDGVILGPNKSSLGGVLHDENEDPITAELLPIKVFVITFVESRWFNTHKLSIESHNLNVDLLRFDIWFSMTPTSSSTLGFER